MKRRKKASERHVCTFNLRLTRLEAMTLRRIAKGWDMSAGAVVRVLVMRTAGQLTALEKDRAMQARRYNELASAARTAATRMTRIGRDLQHRSAGIVLPFDTLRESRGRE